MSAVEQLTKELHDQPAVPLKPNQIKDYEEEMDRATKVAQAPPYVTGIDRGAAENRRRQIDSTLRNQAPRQIDEPMRRDKVAKLADRVLREEIVPALQSQVVMRRNPAGAVGAFLTGENSKPVKTAIGQWRRAMRALDPQNEDPDYTNVERYRPTGMIPGAATYMADAQIPGVFAMTPTAKENWPLGEPKVETPVAQAKKRELSDEQRQEMGRRLAEGRAKKAAAKAAAAEVQG